MDNIYNKLIDKVKHIETYEQLLSILWTLDKKD